MFGRVTIWLRQSPEKNSILGKKRNSFFEKGTLKGPLPITTAEHNLVGGASTILTGRKIKRRGR